MLPFRTHPEMSTTGTGGYLLSGIKLVVQSSATPAGRQSQLTGEAANPPADKADSKLALPAAVHAAQAEVPPPKKQRLEDSSAQAPQQMECDFEFVADGLYSAVVQGTGLRHSSS